MRTLIVGDKVWVWPGRIKQVVKISPSYDNLYGKEGDEIHDIPWTEVSWNVNLTLDTGELVSGDKVSVW